MDSIVISHITSSSPKYQQVWELREEVLRKPLGMSLKNEDLSADHEDTIFIAEKEGTVIGCLMLHPVQNNNIKLRQMAVYDRFQGQGIGKKLVQAAEEFSQQAEYNKIILHARKVATGFYDNMGYNVAGGEFEEVGIPHFKMEKSLVSTS